MVIIIPSNWLVHSGLVKCFNSCLPQAVSLLFLYYALNCLPLLCSCNQCFQMYWFLELLWRRCDIQCDYTYCHRVRSPWECLHQSLSPTSRHVTGPQSLQGPSVPQQAFHCVCLHGGCVLLYAELPSLNETYSKVNFLPGYKYNMDSISSE